jgi:serine/threonine protein kinase
MSLDPGQHVDGVEVGKTIGRGRLSRVYRAHELTTGREVALKVLAAPAGSTVSDRFVREFQLARALAHPHIVEVYRHGELTAQPDRPGALWLTMELVGAGTAADLVPAPDGQPDLARVQAVLSQVAGALDHAHRLDVVHRDVKPTNVLLRTADPVNAVLGDFGIAQFLDEATPLAPRGRVTGSVPYAAPEVLQAHRLTPATDVYSLTCTLVELLTGEPPYPRSTAFAVISAHLTAPPPSLRRRRPWLPGALDDVVARGLAKQPTGRFPTCGGLVLAVAAALDGVAVPPQGPADPRRLLRRFRRRTGAPPGGASPR